MGGEEGGFPEEECSSLGYLSLSRVRRASIRENSQAKDIITQECETGFHRGESGLRGLARERGYLCRSSIRSGSGDGREIT